jgi:hypothetical protein
MARRPNSRPTRSWRGIIRHAATVGVLTVLAARAGAQQVTVTIDAGASVPAGAIVGLRGDTAPLSWDASLPLADPDGDGAYTGQITFADGTGTVEYKAVIESADGSIAWEPGENRYLFPGRSAGDRRAFGALQTGLPPLTITTAQLREDVAVLEATMRALHPGLTLHNSRAESDAIFARLRREADDLASSAGDTIPFAGVYLAMARAVAAIRDGHTQVSMYNQGGYLASTLYTPSDRIPFTFRLVGRRMFVAADATPGRDLPVGTEVLRLDGRPVAEVIDAMMPYASADGGNDAKRLDELQVTGLPAPAERFDVLYGLLFAPLGDLALTVRSPTGEAREIAVPRMSRDARRAVLLARDPTWPQSSGDLLAYRVLPDGTGYLKIGTFATFNMDRDYDAWLTDAFREMARAGVRRLVVDLRGCSGGYDAAAALLYRHLLRAPTQAGPSWHGVTAYSRVPDAVRPFIGSWSDDFYDLTGQVSPAADGTFRMEILPPMTFEPAPDAFDGQVAVLVDAAASSATFYLAKLIKETGVAPLVGQTTGGSLAGLNAGQVAFLTLPHSGIVVDVPLYGNRPPEPGPDHGVQPDVEVVPDAAAVAAGRDMELETAVALLHAPG